MIFRTIISLLAILSLNTYAASGKDGAGKDSCNKSLSPDESARPKASSHQRSMFRIIESPRVPQDAEKYRRYVEELTAPGGTLDKLGIEMTGQIVEFLQPRDLNALTSGTAGGYPVAHYLDGAAVLQSMKPKGGFALEVVYPGPEYQHGFYRDDNKYEQQISIIDHVVGHNHFAFSSGLSHYRVGQGLRATRNIDGILKDVYHGFDKDQAQRYYLRLMTLVPLVDWYTPHYDYSKTFEPKVDVQGRDPLGRTQPTIRRHPATVTENVMPAFAANIATHEPEWKKSLIEEIMVSMSFRPALVHTQIMNEGWASIMQEILPVHSKENHNFAYWFQASMVMQSEKQPNLSDPYSLGVACWRRIRERFEQRPEIQKLKEQVDKDREFIAHAKHIIQTMKDEEFLRFAIDQVFVDRFKLAVVRKAKRPEWDPNLPPPKQQQEPVTQWIVASTDATRVTNMIINNVLKRKYFYNPRVKLVDFNRPASGEVELVIDDTVGRSFPLKTDTLAPSLHALAEIIGKSVSLEASIYGPESTIELPEWIWNLPPYWRDEVIKGMRQDPEVIRARVVVSQSGEVKVYRVTKEREPSQTIVYDRNRILEEVYDPALSKVHAAQLREYLSDLYLEDDKELQRYFQNSPSLRDWTHEAIQKIIETSSYDGIVSQSPNAAGAILEYKSTLERRLAAALERALKKKGSLVTTQGGVRVRALPSPVDIEFDREYIQSALKKFGEEEPEDPDGWFLYGLQAPNGSNIISRAMAINRTQESHYTLANQASPFEEDQGNGGRTVGPINGNEGDRFWGPQDPDGGGGKPRQPGEDPNDLTWVEIPQDLYSRFLGERVKLPKLNRKPGESKIMATKPGGRISRRQGEMLPHEITENALKRGIGSMVGDGDDPFNNLDDALFEGFDMMQPRDWVVKSRRPTKKPDIKAVVTFVLDASGSTQHYYESFKRFVNDMEALIRYNYKGFAFRYVVFDTQAHLMKTRDEFFKAQLGGGTLYEVGLDRTKKLYEDEYPRAQWDRYTFLLGDMEDFNPDQAMAKIKAILDDSEYFGVVAGLYGEPEGIRLMQSVMAEAGSNEFLGYTVLDQDGGYEIDNLKEVLRNKE